MTTAEDELDLDFDPTDLSLREAVAIAETTPGPDEITFDPALVALGPVAIDLSLVGATSLGPTAIQITSNVIITGLAGENGVAIGRDAAVDNLRLFHVTDTGICRWKTSRCVTAVRSEASVALMTRVEAVAGPAWAAQSSTRVR